MQYFASEDVYPCWGCMSGKYQISTRIVQLLKQAWNFAQR